MKLNEEQEKYIARYMSDVGEQLESSPADERAHYLIRLKTQIHRELFQRYQETKVAPGNEDVMRAVSRSRQILGERRKPEPQRTAAPDKEEQPEPSSTVEAASDGGAEIEAVEPGPIWLGVCFYLSDRLGVPVNGVRLVFLILGVTGPLSLFLYLVAYLEMRLSVKDLEQPVISRGKIFKRVLISLACTAGMYGCVYGLVAVSKVLYLHFTQQTLINVQRWGWLDYYQTSLFVGTLALVLPTALLSGLPMEKEWDETALKAVRACIAVYALVLSAGLASYAVGLLLVVADRVV